MNFVILFLLVLGACEIIGEGIYKAAVVEHAANTASFGGTRLLENVQEYQKYIQQARNDGAHIIVFPEYGLTGVDPLIYENLNDYSVYIPDPADTIAPCFQTHYSKVLQDLSCAAKETGINVVVNLLEKVNSTNPNNSTIYYNTNIVFGANGEINTRYRKINLYREPGLTPGNETVTFKVQLKPSLTVNFGIFTCYDILYKKPSQEILRDDSVTDVIYPTAWPSETPFAVAVSTQAGYSKANGVNLLAAGLNKPAYHMSGSGIYVAQPTTSKTYVEAIHASSLITYEVNVPDKRSLKICDAHLSPPTPRGIIGGKPTIVKDFITNEEDMSNYTFKSLSTGSHTYENVCTGDHCCTFNITISEASTAPDDYVYKMAVFHGVRETGQSTIGLRACALVACQNSNTNSCGKRIRNAYGNTTFTSIEISGTFTKNENTYDQPSTLLTDLKQSTALVYCAEDVGGGKVKVTVASRNPVDSILTFGILGRRYDYDNKPPGQVNMAESFNPTAIVVLIMSVIVLVN